MKDHYDYQKIANLNMIVNKCLKIEFYNMPQHWMVKDID